MKNSPLLLGCLGAGAALWLGSCAGTRQSMDLGPSDLSTPPHSLARGDYPFDAGGHYIDAWAASGATRFPASMDTDDERDERPSRRAQPRKTSSKKVASTPSRAGGPKTSPKAKSTTVTVQSGDTLYSLSRKHGVSIGAIKRANGLTSDLLRDGRKVVIPK